DGLARASPRQRADARGVDPERREGGGAFVGDGAPREGGPRRASGQDRLWKGGTVGMVAPLRCAEVLSGKSEHLRRDLRKRGRASLRCSTFAEGTFGGAT